MAAWWLDDANATFDARERAYRLYRERGNPRDAARMATWLAWDYIAFRGERAVANGWLQRARRLLGDVERCPEHAWLALREASWALGEDAEKTRRLSVEARELAESVGDLDLEMTARALEGLALVGLGSVEEGMRLLDEASAAAVGGEMSDRTQIGFACCYLIFACERVRDYDRAAQWCERLSEYCDRTGLRPLFSLCRAHYGGVLTWRGTWAEAEEELLRATADLQARRPAQWGDGLVRLAELRRQQGRLEQARELLGRAEPHPFVPLGRALLHLDRGEPEPALDQVEHFLRALGGERRIERAPGLEVKGRALVGLGRADEAEETLGELRELAAVAGTEPLRAGERMTSGLVARAAGKPEEARACFEDAVELSCEAGQPSRPLARGSSSRACSRRSVAVRPRARRAGLPERPCTSSAPRTRPRGPRPSSTRSSLPPGSHRGAAMAVSAPASSRSSASSPRASATGRSQNG